MPVGLRWGTVTTVRERLDTLIRLDVDGQPCVAYPRLTGPVEEGDTVLVNTRAVELALGSGGFDILYANLTRGLNLPAEDGAHVMSLPYTPGQRVTRFAEEDGAAPDRIDDLVVVCTGLHSQLAPVCAALAGRRVAYVQLGGGALPVSLSDTVRALKARMLLETAIAVSPCVDGDLQCATVAGALTHAAGRGAEVAVCGIGPGIVGTGFADEAYVAVGARLADVEEVWSQAELLLKVKEPIEPEYPRLREGLTLFTYLHIAADEPLTRALLDSGTAAVAYETVETPDRRLPLLAPMSEVAGRLAPQMGAWALEKAPIWGASRPATSLIGASSGSRRSAVSTVS